MSSPPAQKKARLLQGKDESNYVSFWDVSPHPGESNVAHQNRLAMQKKKIGEAMFTLQHVKELETPANDWDKKLAALMKNDEISTSHLFGVEEFKVILQAFGPLVIEGGKVVMVNEDGCSCKALWSVLEQILSANVALLAIESEAFPALVAHLYSFKQKEKDDKVLRGLVNAFIRDIPDGICQEKGFGDHAIMKIDQAICKLYARDEYAKFARFGITLPKWY